VFEHIISGRIREQISSIKNAKKEVVTYNYYFKITSRKNNRVRLCVTISIIWIKLKSGHSATRKKKSVLRARNIRRLMMTREENVTFSIRLGQLSHSISFHSFALSLLQIDRQVMNREKKKTLLHWISKRHDIYTYILLIVFDRLFSFFTLILFSFSYTYI
jgi:prenyltransferase beta subunit